jgi:hypothetical protein
MPPSIDIRHDPNSLCHINRHFQGQFTNFFFLGLKAEKEFRRIRQDFIESHEFTAFRQMFSIMPFAMLSSSFSASARICLSTSSSGELKMVLIAALNDAKDISSVIVGRLNSFAKIIRLSTPADQRVNCIRFDTEPF